MAKAQGTLEGFVTATKPFEGPVFTSQEIRDRGSLFVANIYHASSPKDAHTRVQQMKNVVHSARPASHEISAWRCMVLKPGKSGLGGPEDFELQAGSKDDGESWAGAKVLAVMETLSIIDAVVIVSRWYGGTMLGPARFTHIETCATDVCRLFKDRQELAETRSLLESLDDLLEDLRQQYAAIAPSPSTTSEPSAEPQATPRALSKKKKPDYLSLDVAKAKRLIRVRENSIKSVKSLIAKNQTQSQAPSLATEETPNGSS
ncbi:ribosomal protein S5 domain 2-type protein [Coprinopsis sp. MPI-PUGE-AT-0042]|nr:ribosomal protein S5 domain 2-type protein [Coprinopsis sp. MPI-PUGE-AT-0042]